MDDTLLNSEKQVTKENMDAISEALAAGHKIVFNTGRPLSGFLPILKELGLDREGCYAIAFNGGLIYDCAAKKTLYRRTIPLKYARVIFEKTQEAGLYCHTYSDTSLLCRHAGEETRVYTQAIHIPVVEDPLLPEHLAEEPCKMIVIDLHDRAKMEVRRRRGSGAGAGLSCVSSPESRAATSGSACGSCCAGSSISRVTFVVRGSCPAITCLTRPSSTSTLVFLAIVSGC